MCILFFAQFTAIFLDKKEVAMDTLNTVTLEVSFSNYNSCDISVTLLILAMCD